MFNVNNKEGEHLFLVQFSISNENAVVLRNRLANFSNIKKRISSSFEINAKN